jgi:hypothetical protein
MIGLIIELLFIAAILAGMWKTFEKMGRQGWEGIVPIYNIYIILQIIGKPVWWLVLFFIPFVNLVVAILVFIALAEKFGKGAGFGVGLALLGFVFFPILGFGDAQFSGGSAPAVPGQ